MHLSLLALVSGEYRCAIGTFFSLPALLCAEFQGGKRREPTRAGVEPCSSHWSKVQGWG